MEGVNATLRDDLVKGVALAELANLDSTTGITGSVLGLGAGLELAAGSVTRELLLEHNDDYLE